MTSGITFNCNATALDVRQLLGEVRRHLAAENIAEDDRGTIEIALGEALNNIVEHAYRPDSPGTITLTLSLGETRLCCELRDHGMALPGLTPPRGNAPDVTGARATLPEGGFGWSLIHALTSRLCYLRAGAENRLVLDFDIGG